MLGWRNNFKKLELILKLKESVHCAMTTYSISTVQGIYEADYSLSSSADKSHLACHLHIAFHISSLFPKMSVYPILNTAEFTE